MIEVQLDVGNFLEHLRRIEADMLAGARQALGQSVALALREARATTTFKDRTGELRASIERGQRSTWEHYLRATAKHAAYVEFGTKPHRIEPRNAKVLRFVASGEVRFSMGVNHPGTKGTHFMASAAAVGQEALERLVEQAILRAVSGA